MIGAKPPLPDTPSWHVQEQLYLTSTECEFFSSAATLDSRLDFER